MDKKTYIEIRVRQFIEVDEMPNGQQRITLGETGTRTEMSSNLAAEVLLREGTQYPTKFGMLITNDSLCRGIMSTIHSCGDNEGIDIAAELRRVIATLEELFIVNGEHSQEKLTREHEMKVTLPIGKN